MELKPMTLNAAAPSSAPRVLADEELDAVSGGTYNQFSNVESGVTTTAPNDGWYMSCGPTYDNGFRCYWVAR